MRNYQLSFIALFFTLHLPFTATAQWNSWGSIKGEGERVTKTLDIDPFKGIGLAINAAVHLTQGNQQEVVVKAQQNIIDNIKTKVKGTNWNIGFEDNVSKHDKIDIYITLPTLNKLAIAGSGSIMGKTDFKNLADLSVNIAGSGNIELAGSGRDLAISISGSGKVELSDFKATDCKVSIAGSGDCEINVADKLDVSIAGSGDVKYKGNPNKVKSSIAGSGDVKSF